MAERIEHHFNRVWRAGRRDIYLLRTETGWQVVGRVGGSEGQVVTYEFDDEKTARQMVQRLRMTAPQGQDDWVLMSLPPRR
ncbi:hypothetical protein OWR29_39115 [Actinoplanes sp. Pm04-4]|uniref:Uncharacterized protein n=1 Tax=Paractinoplanes pyxinae TaxID=2997416 RepID=A0ABT4BDH1_9ACTN|nr:hypothetical protein [Actinoplanes pyxinae]MCY1144042.1 hypothetical protein [Actinoplanes pyxinae]